VLHLSVPKGTFLFLCLGTEGDGFRLEGCGLQRDELGLLVLTMLVTERAVRKIMLLRPICQANSKFAAFYGNLEREICQKNLEISYVEGQLRFSPDKMILSFSKLCTVR